MTAGGRRPSYDSRTLLALEVVAYLWRRDEPFTNRDVAAMLYGGAMSTSRRKEVRRATKPWLKAGLIRLDHCVGYVPVDLADLDENELDGLAELEAIRELNLARYNEGLETLQRDSTDGRH